MTPKRIAALVAFDLVAITLITCLSALSVWQIHRRASKLDLIARVEKRVQEIHVPAPGPEAWAGISASMDEYRRVLVTGSWLEKQPVLVQAVTKLGGGYWVMTPLSRNDGTIILVNRGFVTAKDRDQVSSQTKDPGSVTIFGLMRMTEPGGGFLRANEPRSGRWFSRDVAAIAALYGLDRVAPYFIDAEHSPDDKDLPVAGLTVITFPNNHLVYAFTWGLLALMAAAGSAFINLDQVQPRWFRRFQLGCATRGMSRCDRL